MWVHKFNLVGLFLVEVFPFPFFLLIPHSEMYKYSLYLIILLQVFFFANTHNVQVGIGLCGNYGVFNLLTAILCISNFQTITLQIFPNEVSLTKYLITCILIVYFLGLYSTCGTLIICKLLFCIYHGVHTLLSFGSIFLT